MNAIDPKRAMPAKKPISVAIRTVGLANSAKGTMAVEALRSTWMKATTDITANSAHIRLASDSATSTSVVDRKRRRPPSQSMATEGRLACSVSVR